MLAVCFAFKTVIKVLQGCLHLPRLAQVCVLQHSAFFKQAGFGNLPHFSAAHHRHWLALLEGPLRTIVIDELPQRGLEFQAFRQRERGFHTPDSLSTRLTQPEGYFFFLNHLSPTNATCLHVCILHVLAREFL